MGIEGKVTPTPLGQEAERLAPTQSRDGGEDRPPLREVDLAFFAHGRGATFDT
jgi:hypothetical protein